MTAFTENHVETVKPSDLRSYGSYIPSSSKLTYTGTWYSDTSTPDSRLRKFNGSAGAKVSFSVYNVPSITVKLQKDYGWGKATVAVDGVAVGILDSHDVNGGGFLQDVTIQVNAMGETARVISFTAQTSAPFVFTNITLDTSSESLGATWTLIPNNMSITETVTASHSGTFLASAQGSVNESASAQNNAWHGSLFAGAQSETVTTLDSLVASIIALSLNSVSAGDSNTASVPRFGDVSEAATSNSTNVGVRNVFAGTSEAANPDSTDVEHSKHDFLDEDTFPGWMHDFMDAIAAYRESVAESASASEESMAAFRHNMLSNEAVSAAASHIGVKTVGVLEQVTLGHFGSTATTLGTYIEEVVSAQSVEGAIATMNDSVSEPADAADDGGCAMQAVVSTMESVGASESLSTNTKGATAILTEANPFLTDIPAVFRVIAVREVNGGDVESIPSKRLWGRIERSSRSHFTGDAFAPESGRVFPKSDFSRIKPY